jgi:glucuronosyltransferase
MHISDGGQRNIEDSIHHATPVLGISYSSSLEHYLRQIEKFDGGLISYIDFDSIFELTQKIEELATSFK